MIIIKRRTSVFSFAFPKGFGMTRIDSDLRNLAQIRTTKLVVLGSVTRPDPFPVTDNHPYDAWSKLLGLAFLDQDDVIDNQRI